MGKRFGKIMSWLLIAVMILSNNTLTAAAGSVPESEAVFETETETETETSKEETEGETGTTAEDVSEAEEHTTPVEETKEQSPAEEPEKETETVEKDTTETAEEDMGEEPVVDAVFLDGAAGDIETLGENLAGPNIFKNNLENWTRFNDSVESMTPSEDGSSVEIKITDQALGANWGTGLKYTGASWGLAAGTTYEISYKIKSTVDRAIVSDFDENAEADRKKVSLTADREQQVTFRVTPTGAWTQFMFYLGNVDNKNDYGAHDITISDFSIKEVTIELADGTPVEETEGNLLINGTFKDGTTEGWNVGNAFASVKTAKYKVVFDITGDCADWQNWLMQNVTLDSGSKYKIAYTIESSIDRTIITGFDGGVWLGHRDLQANTPTDIEYEVTGTTGGNFAIALGSNLRDCTYDGVTYAAKAQTLGAHRVTISNVRITEMPAELPDTPNDTPYEKITNLSTDYAGYTAAELNPLKDGKFTRGLANWETWQEEWMTTWDTVKYNPVEDGMSVYIENVGDGEKNYAWDAQMNQKISLAANAKYVLSFKVHSEKARAINVVITDIDNGSDWVKPIAIQKGETREVILNVPVLSADAVDKTFSFQMGKVTGDVLQNTLTFTDIKLEVNGYGELAERITDGNFSDGTQGSFTVTGNADTLSASFDENYVKAEIKEACNLEDASISSGTFSLLAGEEYTGSFVAGATENRTIKAVLKDGNGTVLKEEAVDLTTDAEVYRFTYKPAQAVENVSLQFLVGGEAGAVCLDTVRFDLTGYPEAMGLDAEKHDIKLLEKKAAPVISEMPASEALAGSDIVMTFEKSETGTEYYNAITGEGSSISVNGTKISEDKYSITDAGKLYSISLEQSLFPAGSEDRSTFDIIIKAPWYENAHIRQTVYQTQKWSETWLEEFDGTELDLTKWSYQEGTGAEYGVDGWGNNEQQYYTRDNLKVEDGELTITAKKERKDGKKYTSARIWTMDDDQTTKKFAQTYGRVEAKIKTVGGEGYEGVWPAFWMLPADCYYGAWPLSGEIDILEAKGRLPDEIYGTVHYGKPWPNNESSQGGVFNFSESTYNTDSDINGYHVYAVEWEPGVIRWYVDDELFFTYSNWYSQSADNPEKFKYPAPFDQDFYIILNLAVGGTFDGELEPDAELLPVDMKVDYVRVYESTDGYEEVTEEPPVIKDEETDITKVKSELYDKNFEGINYVTEGSMKADVWNMMTLSQFGGAADFETVTEDGTVYAKITPKNLGGAAHAIQLIQDLDLVKGYNYRISFDAKTEGSRKLNMKIGQDGTEGWGVYETDEVALTDTVKHYVYEFQAKKTDLYSRVEFNLATSMQPIYIGNITYEIIDEINIEPDGKKAPTESGNCVWNGSFNVGGIDGLTYWHADNSDAKVVREGQGYVFTATKGNLYQYGINLLQSDTYKLTFDANAESERDIEVIVSNRDGSVEYAKKTLKLGTGRSEQEVVFTMPENVTDEDAKLTFLFGESGAKIYITNIWLVRTTYENVNWDEVNAHPLLNGDFEAGTTYWEPYGNNNFHVEAEGENHFGRVDGIVGGNKWDSMLTYPNLELTAKTDYEFSFDVRASREELLLVTLEDAYYTRQFAAADLEVGTDWTHFSFDLRYADAVNVALKFQMGELDSACTFDFDNVKLSAKGAPKEPGVLSAKNYNRLGEDVVISYSGEDAWVQGAKVYVDNTLVEAEKAVLADGSLTIDKSVFTEPGSYAVTVKSTGYTISKAINVRIYPADGDRIFNGGFNGTLDPWGVYLLNTSGQDSVAVENGMAKIHYGGPAYYEYGLAPWGIQLYQSDIPVEQGKKYQISFIAYATVERQIQVMRNQDPAYGQAGEISEFKSITKEPQVYEVEFVSTSDVLKIQFLLSTIGKDGQNPTEADILENHDIYIDSVCVKEVIDGKVTVDTAELNNLLAECEGLNQKDYTAESWEAFTEALEAAKAVAAKEDAKQAEINAAKDNLKAAKEALTPKEEPEKVGLWAEDIEALTYTGAALKPAVTVYDGTTLLKLNKDYKVSYSSNKAVGTATVTITGKGNYQGRITKNFEIVAKNLNDEDIAVENLYVKAPGGKNPKAVKPAPAVTRNGKKLKANKDYKVVCPDTAEGAYILPGTYKVTIEAAEGSGYTGSRDITITLAGADQVLMSKTTIAKIANQTYDGTEKTPELTVKCGKDTLTPITDYTVEYSNNTEIGTATVTVTGTGTKYVGVKKATFKITGNTLKAGSVQGIPGSVVYTGEPIEPKVQIAGLTEGENYEVTYQNNTQAGKATVIVKGIKNYTGTVKKTFKITAYDISKNEESKFEIISKDITAPYAKGGSKPSIEAAFDGKTLKENVDYTLSYSNNKSVAGKKAPKITIKGKGNFKGSASVEFSIEKQDIGNLKAEAADILVKNAAKYNKVNPVITDLDGKKLKKGTDYTITGYTNADGSEIEGVPEVGAVIKVTAEGKGNYEKTISTTFRVTANDRSIAKTTIKVEEQTYTGSAIEPKGEAVKVTIKVTEGKRKVEKTLVEGTDYEIIEDGYSKNISKGTGKLTIRGINDWGGTKTGTFKIKAQSMSWAEWYEEITNQIKSFFF